MTATGDLRATFTKRYKGGATVRLDLALPLAPASVTVLFGPSGCGKTTVLRCLAGLARPDAGRIAFGGEPWFDAAARIDRRPQERGIGFLFQDGALFPHLTVAGNVGYALRGDPGAAGRVEELLALLQLGGLGGRWPDELSGGQRQRVALARALAGRPRLLLLDEPLAGLDEPTREALRRELGRWLRLAGVPTVLVTHDRGEALALADRLVAMDAGDVVQVGDVADVFSRPVSLAVARLVGVETIREGTVQASPTDGVRLVDLDGTRVVSASDLPDRTRVFVCIRAEDVLLARGDIPLTSARNHLAGRLTALSPEGPLLRAVVDCGFPLTALVTRPAAAELELAPGVAVTALVKASAVHLVAVR